MINNATKQNFNKTKQNKKTTKKLTSTTCTYQNTHCLGIFNMSVTLKTQYAKHILL